MVFRQLALELGEHRKPRHVLLYYELSIALIEYLNANKVIPRQTVDAVTAALNSGYRHIDAAAIYGESC